jgi:hypothetical protein
MITNELARTATRLAHELRCKRICKVKVKLANRIMEAEWNTGVSHSTALRKLNVNLFNQWRRSHFVARGNNVGGRYFPL